MEPLSEQVYLPERIVNRSPVAHVLRTSGPPADMAALVRRTVVGLDPELPVYDVRPLSAFVAGARARRGRCSR